MRRLVVMIMAGVLLSSAFAVPASAMGMFKKRSGNGHNSGSGSGTPIEGGFTGTQQHPGGPHESIGLNTNVLPKDDPTDHDTLLDEVKNPSFTPPPSGWKGEEGKEQFEHQVASPPPSSGEQPYAIPEPMTVSLMGMGLAGLLLKRRLR